jgi:TonB family protein
MPKLTSLLLAAGLLAHARMADAQADAFIESRAVACDAYAGRVDPGFDNVRLYRELSQPDSLLAVRTDSRMSRGQYGVQYVSGHAIVRRSGNSRGVQVSLLLYYRGMPRLPEPAHTLRFRLDDSVEVVPARASYQARRQGTDGETVTLQIVAPVTTAEFMRIAQARGVEGWLGSESFRFTRSERLGLQALHAAIMCGITPVDPRYAEAGDNPAPEQPLPVVPRLGLDCFDAAGRPALVAADFKGAYPVTELDERPKLVSTGPHRTPTGLEGQRGRVELQFVVDTTGAVEPCTMSAGESSDTRFIQAAVDMVRWSRFTPGRKDGKKVRALVRQGITFE